MPLNLDIGSCVRAFDGISCNKKYALLQLN